MTSGVNIPQTANDLDTDSIAFECEELAKQAEALIDAPGFVRDHIDSVLRLIASTNRNMARMMNRG